MQRLVFLGTGGSAGVPMIGCHCSVCQSEDFRNKRLRPAALLEMEGKRIVFDVGPDFRLQALRAGIDRLDGVILTHAHSDHVAGLDELRVYYLRTKRELPILASEATMGDLRRRYDYLFQKRSGQKSLTAQLEFMALEGERGGLEFCGLPFTYVSYEQGGMKVNGFRYKDFAYVVDIRNYPDTIFEDLRGVKTLVLSALGVSSSLMHLSFQEAIDFMNRVGVTRGYITHLSHEVDYEKGSAYFPKHIMLAYDGLCIEL